MYIPNHFEETRVEVLHDLIRAHPFAVVVVLTGAGIEANHIPLALGREPPPLGTLRGHIARANPLWREARPELEALAIFQGPDAYISPSWYPSRLETGKVVPTWNFVAVQAHGRLEVREDPAWLRGHLEELTDQIEAGRDERWRVADAPAEFIDKLVDTVVGIEIQITRITGKWKVSQNRSATDRAGVVKRLMQEGSAESIAMAELVHEYSGKH